MLRQCKKKPNTKFNKILATVCLPIAIAMYAYHLKPLIVYICSNSEVLSERKQATGKTDLIILCSYFSFYFACILCHSKWIANSSIYFSCSLSISHSVCVCVSFLLLRFFFLFPSHLLALLCDLHFKMTKKKSVVHRKSYDILKYMME